MERLNVYRDLIYCGPIDPMWLRSDFEARIAQFRDEVRT